MISGIDSRMSKLRLIRILPEIDNPEDQAGQENY